jgi:hypothetical protein
MNLREGHLISMSAEDGIGDEGKRGILGRERLTK